METFKTEDENLSSQEDNNTTENYKIVYKDISSQEHSIIEIEDDNSHSQDNQNSKETAKRGNETLNHKKKNMKACIPKMTIIL